MQFLSILLLTSVLAQLCSSSSQQVTLVPSTHSKNCSHSISEKTSSHAYGERATESHLESGAKSCAIAHIVIDTKNEHTALDLLMSVADNDVVRKIVIKSDVVDLSNLGSVIDIFAAENPWWVLKAENYNLITAGNLPHEVVFVRYHSLYENQLRVMSAIQFPPQHGGCDATPFIFGRMLNSGWGSMMSMFSMRKEGHAFNIFDVWYSKYNSVQESMAMIHADDCHLSKGEGATPNPNRWDCLFLPRTNCSLDAMAFTHCHGGEDQPDCFRGDFYQVCDATKEGGALMRDIDDTESCHSKELLAVAKAARRNVNELPVNEYQRDVVTRYAEKWQYMPGQDGEEEEREKRFNIVGPFINAREEMTSYPQKTVTIFYSFGLIFRPNFFLRNAVRIKIAELVESKSVPYDPVEVASTTGCVAIHIRRGDRMIPGADMKEACALYTLNGTMMRNDCKEDIVEGLRRVHHPNDVVTCQRLLDMGCYNVRSFGELTLRDYLDRAALLSPVSRHAFVMSDDGPWLEGQIQQLEATPALRGTGGADRRHVKWSVGRLAAAPDSRIDQGGERNGTTSSIDWWASIELARHCHAFVGHFSSEVSIFVYKAMCYHYDKHTGVCPPGSDIGGEAGLQHS